MRNRKKNPPAPRCFAFPLIKGDHRNNPNRGIVTSPFSEGGGGGAAFTLVELIVVVTILAILATIGFVSYSSYLTGVRDTNRIAQMTSLSDGLNLYSTRNDLPIPEDNVEVSVNSNLIAYQGYAGANILETINFEKGGVDPKDDAYFSYYLTRDRKYFQLMGFLEEGFDTTAGLNVVPSPGRGGLGRSVAQANYQNRIPTVAGKKLGILTDTDNTPIQEIGSDLDITLSTTGYKAYFAEKEIFEDADLLKINPVQSCKRIKELQGTSKSGRYTINPDGSGDIKVYCDMETDLGGWTLVGVSNGNYPSATFLDGETGATPKSLTPGYEYSIDASDIYFEEVAMGLDGDIEKYFAFEVPSNFVNDRAFEATAGSPETCTLINGYYSKDRGAKKYWREHYGFRESLITNRRITAGGIDLANNDDCEASGNSIAVYRGSSHTIGAGNGATVGGTWANLPSTTRIPTTASLSQSDFPELGIDRDVWIMVR